MCYLTYDLFFVIVVALSFSAMLACNDILLF